MLSLNVALYTKRTFVKRTPKAGGAPCIKGRRSEFDEEEVDLEEEKTRGARVIRLPRGVRPKLSPKSHTSVTQRSPFVTDSTKSARRVPAQGSVEVTQRAQNSDDRNIRARNECHPSPTSASHHGPSDAAHNDRNCPRRPPRGMEHEAPSPTHPFQGPLLTVIQNGPAAVTASHGLRGAMDSILAEFRQELPELFATARPSLI